MHPYSTPEQTTQFVTDHMMRLHTEAWTWRRLRRATRTSRVNRRPAA